MNAQNDLFEGRRRRDKILDEHVQRRKWLLGWINKGLVTSALGGDGTMTSDDACDRLDVLEGIYAVIPRYDRRFLGAVWRQGPWVKTGEYVQSRRPERHARPIPVWEYRPEATP